MNPVRQPLHVIARYRLSRSGQRPIAVTEIHRIKKLAVNLMPLPRADETCKILRHPATGISKRLANNEGSGGRCLPVHLKILYLYRVRFVLPLPVKVNGSPSFRSVRYRRKSAHRQSRLTKFQIHLRGLLRFAVLAQGFLWYILHI